MVSGLGVGPDADVVDLHGGVLADPRGQPVVASIPEVLRGGRRSVQPRLRWTAGEPVAEVVGSADCDIQNQVELQGDRKIEKVYDHNSEEKKVLPKLFFLSQLPFSLFQDSPDTTLKS